MVVLQLLTPSGSTYSLLNPLPWLSMLVLTTTVCKIILDTSKHSLLPNLFLSLLPPFLPFPISLVLFLLLCMQPASSSPSQNIVFSLRTSHTVRLSTLTLAVRASSLKPCSHTATSHVTCCVVLLLLDDMTGGGANIIGGGGGSSSGGG